MADRTPQPAEAPPYLVAFNLTRRCNLDCAHCYLDAGTRQNGDVAELDSREAKDVLDRIAALNGEALVVLTGGEPLMRPDLAEIAAHAAKLGLMVVVGSNGTLLDDRRATELQRAGVRAVGISLDSLDPACHDGFRGRPGAWLAAMKGIDACRRAGLLLQIHFTVMDRNAAELDAMVEFARATGAVVLNVFFLVCVGRGQSVVDISSATYERVLMRVAQIASRDAGPIVRVRCAPHFKRVALQASPPLPITLLDGYEAGGCPAGTRYFRITPEGEVTPCPYIEQSVGSVRRDNLAHLWRSAPLFARLRQPELKGRCGNCEYARLCGGCRARPLARSGDIMGEDFLCSYTPTGGPALSRSEPERCVAWTPEADARLAHVPPFIRGFVRRRAEAHAIESGTGAVTEELLLSLARARFARGGPLGQSEPIPAPSRSTTAGEP